MSTPPPSNTAATLNRNFYAGMTPGGLRRRLMVLGGWVVSGLLLALALKFAAIGPAVFAGLVVAWLAFVLILPFWLDRYAGPGPEVMDQIEADIARSLHPSSGVLGLLAPTEI